MQTGHNPHYEITKNCVPPYYFGQRHLFDFSQLYGFRSDNLCVFYYSRRIIRGNIVKMSYLRAQCVPLRYITLYEFISKTYRKANYLFLEQCPKQHVVMEEQFSLILLLTAF